MTRKNFVTQIKIELLEHGGKISPDFIQNLLNHPETKVLHSELMSSTRVCVIVLPTGHNAVGVAQVLDPNNDVESIGQSVAYKNAAGDVWSIVGNVAKGLI